MTLRLDDRWVWDFWLADDGPLTHVFYLQAPRSLRDPDARHHNARIGHAVSPDLHDWTVLEDPLPPARPGAWDDLATWTGSVIRGPDGWTMLYTGLSTRDRSPVQRIGIATSTDLDSWERFGDAPILEPDARWYERPRTSARHAQTWRDPWLFADPTGDGFHALITARCNSGADDTRGVIGHATSPDLRTWTVRPPLPSPAGFGELEVPQVVPDGDSFLLVFCTGPQHVAAERVARHGRPPVPGTYVCRGDGWLGPFDVPLERKLEPVTGLYAGKLVRRDGQLLVMGFRDIVDGRFVGELADPVPFDATDVAVAATSTLSDPPTGSAPR